MTLIDFIKGLGKDELDAFARACGTSVGQLKQIAYGYRRASAGLAIEVDRCSEGAVTCEELRPDIRWSYLRLRTDSSPVAA